MSGESIRCFMLEPIPQAILELRRFRLGDVTCSAKPGRWSYCNAFAQIARVDIALDAPLVGPPFDHADPRWPVRCSACDFAFEEADYWQVNLHRLYQRGDGGGTCAIHDAPPGAMWDAPWLAEHHDFRGPDGRCLVVQTPAGEWVIDGKSRNGGRWTREGTPPRITVQPSIGIGEPFVYHGWLRDGMLVPA